MSARRLWQAILVGLALGCLVPTACPAGPFPTAYDRPIRQAWNLWSPGDDWHWWKAQLWQESHLDPDAVSPAGAEGIAQFMRVPGLQYGLVDRRLAEPSIMAGAHMMHDMTRFWRAPRTSTSRRRLAQASYNAGAGNILKAQKRCGGMEYEQIVPCLPQVTGPKNARETWGYAPRIESWYRLML